MHIRYVGQILVFFAFALIVWNILVSEFGRWTVRSWFDGITPVDVMFLIAVGMVALLLLTDRRSSGGGGQPPKTRTMW